MAQDIAPYTDCIACRLKAMRVYVDKFNHNWSLCNDSLCQEVVNRIIKQMEEKHSNLKEVKR